MLIGQYEHSIDEKGRLIMPQKLREALGEEFIVTRGWDECLFVMPMDEWTTFENKIRSLPMAQASVLQRVFFSKAAQVSPDKQGRVLLANHLREAAGLTKDVVIVGADTRVEIWDAAAWEKWVAEQESKLGGGSLLKLMEEIGV